MKKCKLLLPIVVILIGIWLCGCGSQKHVYTETGLKKVAEKSLKKKYNEEFVVHNVWSRDQERFFADCSPMDNPEIVFQATIYKNGKGVYDDEYPEAVVAKQVEVLLNDSFRDTFGDCYLRVTASKLYNRPEFVNISDLTVEKYLNETHTIFLFSVYVRDIDVTDDIIQNEYIFMTQTLKTYMDQNIMKNQDFSVVIYNIDQEDIEKCREYFSHNTDVVGDFHSEYMKYKYFSFNCRDSNIDKTCEDYRMYRNKLDQN